MRRRAHMGWICWIAVAVSIGVGLISASPVVASSLVFGLEDFEIFETYPGLGMPWNARSTSTWDVTSAIGFRPPRTVLLRLTFLSAPCSHASFKFTVARLTLGLVRPGPPPLFFERTGQLIGPAGVNSPKFCTDPSNPLSCGGTGPSVCAPATGADHIDLEFFIDEIFNREDIISATLSLSGAVEMFVGQHTCLLLSTCNPIIGQNAFTGVFASDYIVMVSPGGVTPPPPDVTPPTITITTPPDGAVYGLNQVVNANYSCADEPGGSGLASCTGNVANGTPIDTSSSGSKSFVVTARDNAGNPNTLTHSYTVVSCDDIVRREINGIKPVQVFPPNGPQLRGRISAAFQPNFGLTLAQAASICGYDHFNWYQLVSDDPYPPQGLSRFYIDPPAGGGDAFGGPADNLPFYWDEREPSSNRYRLQDHMNTTILDYSDIPSEPNLQPNESIKFTTALVGIRPGQDTRGQPIMDVIYVFSWQTDLVGNIKIRRGDSFPSNFTDAPGGIFNVMLDQNPADFPPKIRRLLVDSGAQNVPVCVQTVIDFESAPTELNGVFEGIDWDRQWLVDDLPCGACPPRLAYFNSPSRQCRTFKFVTPSILESFTSSAHVQDGHLKLRSFDTVGNVMETFNAVVTHDACTLFETNWAKSATSVEVCFDYGWELAFDNVTYCTP